MHQRYIRKELGRLVSVGVIRCMPNPTDKRGRIYYITTDDPADPLITPGKDPLFLREKTPNSGQFNPNTGNQTDILPNCNQKIGDQNRGSFDPQKDPLNLGDQTTNPTNYENLIKNQAAILPNYNQKIGDQNRGSFEDHLGDLSPQNTGNQNLPLSMHGKPENPPQFRPEIGDQQEIGDQNRGSNHPGTCSITENPTGHVCHNCPLTVCDLEHDAIQFGIVDAWAANHLPKLAAAKRWERRQNPHTGVWTLYPPALHPLTLQCGVDTITVYSSEPGDTNWIVAWFGLQIGPQHPHPEQLAHKLRHPEIYRDEQTIVIRDPPTKDALMSVSAPWADPISGVRYIPSPNTVTPALKIYQRSTGEVRMEFDSRDQTRARAALVMRQELLQLLPQLALHPGLWLEWQQRYYNPVTQPVIINLEQDAVVSALQTLNETLSSRFNEIEARIDNMPTNTELQDLIAAVDALEDFELQEVIDLLCSYIGNHEAVNVYLSAWAIWADSKYSRPVLIEDVTNLMRRRDIPISHAEAWAAIKLLTAKGLLVQHPDRDITFSRAAIRIGRKLIARQQAPGL